MPDKLVWSKTPLGDSRLLELEDIPHLIVIRTEKGYLCGQFADGYNQIGEGYVDSSNGCVDGWIANRVGHRSIWQAISLLRIKISAQKAGLVLKVAQSC